MLFLSPLSIAFAQRAPDSQYQFADYIEPGFPFINTTLHLDSLGTMYPDRNVAVRCLVLQLANDAHACFDTDLLRMAAIWRGEGISLESMPQVSYHKAGNKVNGVSEALGDAIAAMGMYPGWQGGAVQFDDPRPVGPNLTEPGRGPVSDSLGRWNGVYVRGDEAILSYRVLDAGIEEAIASFDVDGQIAVVRNLKIEAHREPLTLMLGEFREVRRFDISKDRLIVHHAGGDSVTVVGRTGGGVAATLKVFDGTYAALRLAPRAAMDTVRLVLWKGMRTNLDVVDRMMALSPDFPDTREAGPAHWPRAVVTRGAPARNENPFVVDDLTLPIPNPWRRNVRVSGLDFFDDGRAAVSTFEGDVWLISGIDRGLQNLRWKRYASGLSEPMSLNIVDGQIYVFGREGIVRLHDLNGDEEADFYENFSNLPVQTAESREFPLSMHPKPGGGFYLSKGGALNAGPRTNPPIMEGFRAGGPHSGSVLEVSADGRAVKLFASGLREPYLTVHPETGWVTASDQQGNFVPSTPIYRVQEGDYFGVPATAHRETSLPVAKPLTWAPHQVDRSATEQVWVLSETMGPLNGALVHLSYGKPAAYRIYYDATNGLWQGGITELPIAFSVPLMKGAVSPADGQLYLAGFQVWDSDARRISGLVRVRYTGGALPLPVAFKAGKEGVVLRFDQKLNPKSALRLANYALERWEYHRTEAYGSGHFKRDGTPGHESLRVAGVALSEDRKGLFLRVDDMREAMQVALQYRLLDARGDSVSHEIYFTMNRLPALDLAADGFSDVLAVADEPAGRRIDPVNRVVNAARGRMIYQQHGCIGCHSTDGTTEGRSGPTFKGLYGSMQTFADGNQAVADEAYLRESILDPAARVVEGREVEMPSFVGILTDEDVASLIAYIKSLQ